MGIKPTASVAYLLFNCQRPFDPLVEVERDEPAVPMRYGSAFHAIMAGVAAEDAAMKFDVDPYLQELIAHAEKAKAALSLWLDGENMFGAKFNLIARETPAAWDWVTLTRRDVVEFNEESHTYDTTTYEIAGTADLVVGGVDINSNFVKVVIDYKTGDYEDYSRPDELAQLRTLAVVWEADAVAVLHTPRGGIPVMHVARFDSLKRAATSSLLIQSLNRIGDGSMRPGPHCKFCPAKSSCPTNNAEIVRESNMLLRMAAGGGPLANPVDKGALNQFLQVFEGLRKQAKAALRADVQAGEIILQPNGKQLQMATKHVERLSKASVLRALPGQAGEAKLDELRALGCLEMTAEESMVAK